MSEKITKTCDHVTLTEFDNHSRFVEIEYPRVGPDHTERYNQGVYELAACPVCGRSIPNSLNTVTDFDRIQYLERHPLKQEVVGGAEDGHQGVCWAVGAHSGTLRETLDILIRIERTGQ